MQAFDDVVVLDLTHHIVGPYATRLLAAYGADVIKVEPPGGDIARRLPPFRQPRAGDVPRADGSAPPRQRHGAPVTAGGEPTTRDHDQSLETSGLFLYLNTDKRSVVLDLRSALARDALRRLAERADIVVENHAPGTLDRLGCGWDFFHAVKPSLSLISISNFGQDGPYRDFKASDLVMYGFAGEMYSMGSTDREPVKMAGTAALFESGSAAAVAATGALFASRRFGIGQHVDVSIAETHAGGVDRRHATAIAYQFSGRRTLRASGSGSGMPQGIYPCADGFVDFTNAGGRPERVADMIGEQWARDPRYLDRLSRLNADIVDEWNAHFIPWCLERTKREVWAEARRARVMCGPLFSMEDIFTDAHFRDRGFWHTVQHPVMGEVEMPGRPFIMARGGWQVRRPAPLLGQHTSEVFHDAGMSDAEIEALSITDAAHAEQEAR